MSISAKRNFVSKLNSTMLTRKSNYFQLSVPALFYILFPYNTSDSLLEKHHPYILSKMFGRNKSSNSFLLSLQRTVIMCSNDIDGFNIVKWQFPNRCFLCGCEEETVNHILLHCTVVWVLWEIVLVLFGIQWVFPETIKDMLFSWRGSFVGKKRKKIWISIPLCIFWTVWKERNRLAFREGGVVSHTETQKFFCM